jgi:hypothetical protein
MFDLINLPFKVQSLGILSEMEVFYFQKVEGIMIK